MFRLLGFFLTFAIVTGGYMFVDYRMSARWAGAEDADGLTFSEYLSGLSGRLAGLGGASAAGGLPSRLSEMLPVAPEGWTTRAVEASDIDGFLPKGKKAADPVATGVLQKLTEVDTGAGVEVAAATYESGKQKVIVKAIRYPNIIFTSFMAMQQRMELQMQTAAFRGTEFATVRGLDLTEDLLPEGFRGRLFFADVGAQIHLRILAPKRMEDTDLIPFLETLHVKAMNADVIDKVEGLGDVPVIVLASALEEAARDAYLADVAKREADMAAKEELGRAAAEAAQATVTSDSAEDTGGGFFSGLLGGGTSEMAAEAAPKDAGTDGCTASAGGVKRCKVGASSAED